MNMSSIIEKANALSDRITELRRRFHANPELSWQEVETSRFVEEYLRNLGLENIKRGFGGTECGVMADLKGGKPGRCVALRGDMDALPLEEENDLPYKSTRSGVMHACGHDAHTAVLLAVAEILASMREDLCGTVRFLFQPAEEAGMNSGAPRMIEEGALDGVDAIGGLHVWALLPTGKLGCRVGPIMASADIWDLKIQGKGGHGAMPHKAVDPTVTAATVISTLQTVVSREMDPQDTVVLSVGKLEAGTAVNIIPDTARVAGNIRTTSRAVREQMEGIVKRVADGVCAAMRCTAELTYTPIYPVTVNDPVVTGLLRSVAVDVFGEDKVEELPVAMGSEDYSYFGEKVPAAYVFLGTADEAKGTGNQHHNPRFNVDDEALSKGAALLAGFAARFTAEEAL
jgi:amidohydrolase